MSIHDANKRRELEAELDAIGLSRRYALIFLFEFLWHDPHALDAKASLTALVERLREKMNAELHRLESIPERYLGALDRVTIDAVTTEIEVVLGQIRTFVAHVEKAVVALDMTDREAVIEASKTSSKLVFEQLSPSVTTVLTTISRALSEHDRCESVAAEKSVGEAVDRITALTAATKMVSINASIEAARAGPSGKGFSVIADEIRRLSEASAAALLDIRGGHRLISSSARARD